MHALATLSLAAATASAQDPRDVASRAINAFVKQPFGDGGDAFWGANYGSAIMVSAAYEASSYFGLGFQRACDRRLASFLANDTSLPYKLLNNITMPWDTAIGDHLVYPIAYLARM